MDKIKLGLLGCGICARYLHWPALAQLSELFEVTNVSSRNEEKAKEFAVLVESKNYCTDYHDLLSDPNVEAVVISYPFEMNCELTKKAIAAGKHVLVEKPIAANMDDAAEMVEIAKSTDLVTMVAENYRYRKTILQAKHYLDEGVIGKPCAVVASFYSHFPRDSKWLVESQWRHHSVGGIILDRDVHWMAVFRDLFGTPKNAIGHSMLMRDDLYQFDHVAFHFEFESGIFGSFFDFASITGYQREDIIIVGSAGTIIIDNNMQRISVKNESGLDKQTDFVGDDGFMEEYKDFYNAIRTGTEPRSTFLEGYKDLQFVLTSISTNEAWNTLQLKDQASFNS